MIDAEIKKLTKEPGIKILLKNSLKINSEDMTNQITKEAILLDQYKVCNIINFFYNLNKIYLNTKRCPNCTMPSF